ncbi:tyrosine-protein phosphatase [Formosa sp. S-31]|uniref:tyrosine-protein phosphatase n=1 Tax=Formosa sp. S-31 TaxID=2790949 RepID=UPI003EB7E8EA
MTIKKRSIFAACSLLAFSFISCSNDEDSINEQDYVTYDNHIELIGEDNMRDLGGFVGAENKRILYRKLFRSGELSALTAEDQATLIDLGINQVIDLRTDSEVEEAQDVLPADIAAYHYSLIDDSNGATNGTDYMAMVMSGELKATDLMLPAYSEIDTHREQQWEAIFDLLEQDNAVSLWHCTAGKDRAGMTTALVLTALGVDKETIIEDFMNSNTYLSEYIENTVAYMNSNYGPGVGELLRPLLGVERDYIDAFYTAVNEKYGSMDNFLEVLKVDVQKLRAIYLEK